MTEPMLAYLQPTQHSGAAFMRRGLQGPVVMLNLLRFRDLADYRADPQLAPATPISGAQAFERYVQHTLPFLQASGGEMLLLAEAGPWLIGPQDEHWHQALLIRQHSVEAFMAFAQHGPYLAGLGHRTAALADSRLLPLSALPLPIP
ncbi:DUF1330 domain-containing protein [Stenotrophomonas sp. 24(2023)]|uniref:DUF1330 domain-containing protein n=1 Tax=Stenotrophomonas sp. 24(2023) TaxID=3068324 RepID=UPI0027E1DCF4|nr:DUF1330 domain-containing protein [Stenotrophomonas sp. 24(2023)]WMJ69623.1 DUF1330 domain-containing protein [Stenotrophomonas sp. 24(2023)]